MSVCSMINVHGGWLLMLLLAFLSNKVTAQLGAEPCDQDEFRCNDNECIPSYDACMGYHEGCTDGSDKTVEACKQMCQSKNKFLCANNQQCIGAIYHCDGFPDCDDASDEKDCLQNDCARNFKCPNENRCLYRELVCNGDFDCKDADGNPDRSDELDCYENNCNSNNLLCKDRVKCIEPSHICNGKSDCFDGSDESTKEGIYKQQECKELCSGEERYWCAADSMCLQNSFACDGYPQCSDKEDEKKCYCTSQVHIPDAVVEWPGGKDSGDHKGHGVKAVILCKKDCHITTKKGVVECVRDLLVIHSLPVCTLATCDASEIKKPSNDEGLTGHTIADGSHNCGITVTGKCSQGYTYDGTVVTCTVKGWDRPLGKCISALHLALQKWSEALEKYYNAKAERKRVQDQSKSKIERQEAETVEKEAKENAESAWNLAKNIYKIQLDALKIKAKKDGNKTPEKELKKYFDATKKQIEKKFNN